VAVFVIAVTLAVAAEACDRSSSNRPAFRPLAPTPDPSVMTHLTIDGPSSVPPGGTVQFTATAHYQGGSSRDVTREATWRSSDPSVLAVAPGGLATGIERGETSMTVAFENRTAVRLDMIVLPAGTYRLLGLVTDSGLPVPAATVRVTRGEGSGLTAATAFDGRFRLYGIGTDVEVRVTKEGYLEAIHEVRASSHFAQMQFTLTLSGPRQEVGGTYTLTITAAGSCSTLPREAHTRTYTATLVQKGGSIEGTLGGSHFLQSGSVDTNRFSGAVGPDEVRFRFSPGNSSYWPDFVEILTPDRSAYLTIVGDAVTTETGAVRSGRLSGVIETWDSRFRVAAVCRAADHDFVLSR
jgi:hypothetical protein